MSELRELYQEVILDHNRHPRNFGRLEEPSHHAEGRNPLCGDAIDLTVLLDGDRIVDLRFEGQGCAISTASASVMTELVKGKNIAEAMALFDTFHGLVTGKDQPEDPLSLGKMAVFSGVAEFPIRVKCASLAWHTLKAAVERCEDDVVTTE